MTLSLPPLESGDINAPSAGAIDLTRDVTLQVNLCAGDIDYARQTVPRLVAAHPPITRRLAVVDCCRPQRTRIYDPDARLPPARFDVRTAEVRTIAEEFRHAGLFDRIEYLVPGDPRFSTLARRYVRPWMTETHDYGGCAFMGYWAALDFPATRFVLHYDADMLLHTESGYDWAAEALGFWPAYPQVLAACPRISPPGFARRPEEDAPSLHEGRRPEPVAGGWLNDWFSTRCFLFDRERLAPRLPLVRGWRAAELRLRRIIDRGYPPGPEQELHRRLGGLGLRSLHLGSERAWLLHPTRKTPEYLEMLPRILEHVARGVVPTAQRGYADLRLADWAVMLKS